METIKQIINFIVEQIFGYYLMLILCKIYNKIKQPLKTFSYAICICFGMLICLPFLSYIIANDLLKI